MIPQIPQVPGIARVVLDFLQLLQQQGFQGDLATDYATRLNMATDNSVYQLLPDAVIFPSVTEDVVLAGRMASEERFHALTFTARGGGTGTNGQALNTCIVVDMSRHMNHILEINLQQRWVRVQAGVIKDQLDEYLRPLGYFFSPELSTSNRATLGGMINTDASGQGSRVYGKTSDHVLGLRAVLIDGEILDTCALSTVSAQAIAQENSAEGRIYRTVLERCREQRPLIVEKFPKLNRFLTGYDLYHVFSEDLQMFNLTRILTGSEGTLAFVTEAKLAITPLPAARRLVNIKYQSFDAALRSASLLLEANALSVETIDTMVLNLAREDIIWHFVSALITEVPGKKIQAINIVEFAGDDALLLDNQVTQLCRRLDELIATEKTGVIGYQVCHSLAEIEHIYAMRKKAVGLLGNSAGAAKPIAFVEDTCVPPEHLADYIHEFRQLLDRHNLVYGMFGHVDAGVLHVRPALDMTDAYQQGLIKQLSDAVVQLTIRYGGLLWGEHGKGLRSEYVVNFFGETLYRELQHIKSAFDPHNRLNPGKICTPLASGAEVMTVDARKRGFYDSQIAINVRTSFRGALDCNGNGLCFNFDAFSPMCPSMKITRNRLHSPKGRATLIREWLRLLAEQGVNLIEMEKKPGEKKPRLLTSLQKIRHSWYARRGEYDFSHEVKAALSGCLACQACATQCPVKIDVPAFFARFLQLYHTRYLRPVRDYLIAALESYVPLMATAPGFFNALFRQRWIQHLTRKMTGLVDTPLLSVPSLKQQLSGHYACTMTVKQLEQLSDSERKRHVLIVQDLFTSFYDTQVVTDFIRLAEKLGFHPVLLPFSPAGKAQYIKGFLHRFAKTAEKTTDFLKRIAMLGIPVVGIEPAVTLFYRSEYKKILPEKHNNFTVQLIHEWLQAILPCETQQTLTEEPWYLFTHCTESTALPASSEQWAAIFACYGAKLAHIPVGCCGMAGVYGHEAVNSKNSSGIYALSWQQQLQKLPPERCLATGWSCRSQVKRIDDKKIKHPLQALLEIIECYGKERQPWQS